MEFIKPNTNINFVGFKRFAYGFSIILILASILSLAVHKGPKWGVDFTGGLLVQIKFDKQTTPKEIREGLAGIDMSGSIIQRFGAAENNEFLIRTEDKGADLEGLGSKVQESLEQKFGSGALEVRRVEMVGAQVGQDLRDNALFAIFYAILLIVIYISGRFEMKWITGAAVTGCLVAAVYLASLIGAGVTYLIVTALVVTLIVCFIFKLKYALGAIIALIHDVTITVGVFSVLNLEVTLPIVAALLTIIGYSLNDTIIVFDRIRETLKKARKQTFAEVINRSINDTLSRTILTSGTTLLVVISLFIFGGPVIHDFALALIIGIGIGTYSSIYVASPILLLWPPEMGSRKAKTEPAVTKKGGKRKRNDKS